MKIVRFVVFPLAALALAFSSSCAATKGFGQDLQKVGNRIESRADATGGAEPDRPTGIYPAPAPAAPAGY